MKKTLVVLAGYAPSLINFRLHLLLEFQKRGYEVIACAPQTVDWVTEKLGALGISFYSFPLNPATINPVQDLAFIKKFTLFLKKKKPEVFFAYTIKPVIYGSIAAHRAGVPRIFSFITGLGYTFEKSTWKQKLLSPVSRTLYSIALKTNDTIFFQNEDDVAVFRENKILNKDSKIIITNGSGVDLEYFSFDPTYPEQPVFLLIARILKSKGILEYIEAAKIVKQTYPHTEFHLVGYFYNSPDAIEKEVIDRAHTEGTIVYKGETNDVRPFLRKSSVYVLPSYREGTPRTVLEAMAMGRPIVTTNVPGCKETVVDGENGFLVEAKSPVSLARAMIKFLEDRTLIPKMGKRSREIAERKFDVHNVNKTIVSAMGL